MRFTLLTLFPDMFPGSLGLSLAGKALQGGIWGYHTVNIREYAYDKHATVDDVPYGGGTGMVLRPDVLGAAITANTKERTRWLYMSPRGRLLEQGYVQELAAYNGDIGIICGRYEGVDERILEAFNIEEVSIGDYILSGGEVAALTLMDACIRLLPGVISKETALNEESFGQHAEYAGLLEYPLYTRPSTWEGRSVPEVLRSGNHQEVARWRLAQSQAITRNKRPDLWAKYQNKQEQ